MAAPAWLGPGWTIDSETRILSDADAYSYTVGTDTGFANFDDPDFGPSYKPPIGTTLYTIIETATNGVEGVYVEPSGRIITGLDLVPDVTAFTTPPIVCPPGSQWDSAQHKCVPLIGPQARRSVWGAVGAVAAGVLVPAAVAAVAQSQGGGEAIGPMLGASRATHRKLARDFLSLARHHLRDATNAARNGDCRATYGALEDGFGLVEAARTEGKHSGDERLAWGVLEVRRGLQRISLGFKERCIAD